MPAPKFAEVHWPPLDRKNPAGQAPAKAESHRDPTGLNVPDRVVEPSHAPAETSAKSSPSWFRRGAGGVAQPAVATEKGPAVTETQTTIHAQTTEIPLPSPSRNGDDEISPIAAGPAQQAHLSPALLGDLAALESRCVDLAGHLSEVVQELLSGKVHYGSLASDLTALQADVESLKNRTAGLAVSLDVPADAAACTSLGELRAILTAVAEAEGRRDFRLLHARAAQELEYVLALEYSGSDGANPLDGCQVAGRRLLKEIAGAEWPNAHAESARLAGRQHAYSRLLDLVRQPEKLSDDDWDTAEETVAAVFGRRVAVAAVRGRVRVKSSSKDAKEDAKTCPACGAQLEAGAKFCGDCGVRIE